jgi:predicted nucleic acid-binding protein
VKKIRIYLDTNTIVDYFINQVKAIKEGKELRMTEKMKFFTTNLDKFNFVASFLTKTEVGRELASGFDLQKIEIEKLWNSFVEALKCKVIEKFEFDMKLADLAIETRMKLRTIVNFQHLYIAMSEDAYFVTGDKDLIKIVKEKKIYDKFLSYIDLREMII